MKKCQNYKRKRLKRLTKRQLNHQLQVSHFELMTFYSEEGDVFFVWRLKLLNAKVTVDISMWSDVTVVWTWQTGTWWRYRDRQADGWTDRQFHDLRPPRTPSPTFVAGAVKWKESIYTSVLKFEGHVHRWHLHHDKTFKKDVSVKIFGISWQCCLKY